MRDVFLLVSLIVIGLFVSCEMEPAPEPEPPPTYTISFSTDGGNSIPDQTVSSDSTATKPTDPIRDGYTFDSWYNSMSGDVYDFSTPITHDLVLYATWNVFTPISYTITFDTNGGSNIDNQIITSGGALTRPNDPTREDYTFDNWYDSADMTSVYDFSNPVTHNFFLYAKWNADGPTIFTISFNSNGGSKIIDMTVNSGEVITRPANPIRDGYTFDNWYSDLALISGYNFTTPITGDITLYAKWTKLEPEEPENIEPYWLPDSLKGKHPYNGIWSRGSFAYEDIYHTNFKSARDFIDELVGVIKPGYTGIENGVSSSYGSSDSYFQSVYITPENVESICTYAKTYAASYYLDYIKLQNYLDEKENIYSFVHTDNSMDAEVYKPYSTVTQVSSRLWIYELDDDTVGFLASGDVEHGDDERTFLDVYIIINSEERIAYKSGYIYTFTPDDGGEPSEYDLRTVTDL